MNLKEIRVLIADSDNNFANRMSSYLRESGFSAKSMNSAYLLKKSILEWRPHFIFIDLLFPGLYGQECLKFLKEKERLGENKTQVIIMSKHTAEANVKNCLQLGAADFMVKPIKMLDLLQRLSLLSQIKNYNLNAIAKNNDQQIKNYFKMMNLLVKAPNQNKAVSPLRLELITMVSLALKAVRTSIIVTNSAKDHIKVIRSSDDESLENLPLDLKKYPEIQYVLRTEKDLFIESLEKDYTMSFVKNQVKSIQFDSMMVLPLIVNQQLQGCLSIRMPKDCKQLSFYDIKIAEVAAQLIAMTWKFSENRSQIKAA